MTCSRHYPCLAVSRTATDAWRSPEPAVLRLAQAGRSCCSTSFEWPAARWSWSSGPDQPAQPPQGRVLCRDDALLPKPQPGCSGTAIGCALPCGSQELFTLTTPGSGDRGGEHERGAG